MRSVITGLLAVLLALTPALPMQDAVAAPKGKEPQVTVIGLIGSRAILRIEGQQQTLAKGESRDGVTLLDVVAGQALLDINGRVVDMLVDTGANTVSMTTDDARQLGVDYLMEGRPAMSATAAGMVRIWVVTLKSVQVGPIVVRNVQASVREAPRISPVLLGMSFLSQVDMRHEQNRLKMTAR